MKPTAPAQPKPIPPEGIVITTHSALKSAFIARRKEIGIVQLETDWRAGIAHGLTGKIECNMRGLGDKSLPALLEVLGLVLKPKQPNGELR